MKGYGRARMGASLFLGLLVACSGPEQAPPPDSTPHPLVGRWTTDDVIVFYDASGRSLDARTFRVAPADWSEVLGLLPREVSFAADGTYTSEQRGIDGSVVEQTSGRWAAFEDALTLVQLIPTNAQLHYRYEVDGSRLTFEARVDWDSDGAEDDFYVARGRRLPSD